MVKSQTRAYQRYTREATELLGHLIRAKRIERKMTTLELAERAGVSRALLYRIETGDLNCSIGAVFETAAIVGVTLFSPDLGQMTTELNAIKDRLTLLPRSIRQVEKAVKDDF